jgi:uncharacterized protein
LKTYLPDVNVWLAMAFSRHVHNQAAIDWFYSVDEDAVAFCRVSQMGFLRLLTNAKVMGKDILSQRDAWNVYSEIHQDPRVTFLSEGAEIEEAWRTLTDSDRAATHQWTDAYLWAFAKSRGLSVVSFDRSFRPSGDPAVLILGGADC